MKEFEVTPIQLGKGLRQFKRLRNTGELEACHNLMPVERGLETHEQLTDLNASGISWGGLGFYDRPMETDTLTLNIASLIFLEILEGVSVTFDGTAVSGTTDSDGNISVGTVNIGIHDVVLTKSGLTGSGSDIIYNDYILVEAKKEVVVNVDDYFTDTNLQGISIYIDGIPFGQTDSSGNVTCWLRPGVHKIRLEGLDYIDGDEDQIKNDYFTVT